MLLVEIAPEHVLHAVGAVEDAHAQAAIDLVQAIEKHGLAFAVGVEALLEKMIVAQDMFAQSPGIFGQAERGIRALLFGQINRVDRRIADGHRRFFRVDIDGRRIQLEFGLGVEQQKLAHAMHRQARHDHETDLDPVGVYVLCQIMLGAADLEDGPVRSL